MELKKCDNCKCLTINKKLCEKCQKIIVEGEKECLICDRTIPKSLVDIRKRLNYKNNDDISLYNLDNNSNYNPNEYGENINLCYYCSEEIKSPNWNLYIEKHISKYVIDNRNHYQYLKDRILNNRYAYYNEYVQDLNNKEFIKLLLIAITNSDLGDKTLINKLPKDIKELKESLFNFDNYKNCIICNEPSDYYLCENCLQEIKDITPSINSQINHTSFGDPESLFNNLIDIVLQTNTFEKQTKIDLSKYLLALGPLINDEYRTKTFYNENNFNFLKKTITAIKFLKLCENSEALKKEEKKLTTKTNNMALDGHILQSDMEMRIDDILTNCNILHYIHKQVEEIYEENIISDFFIPIKNDKGIYIEYWGMKTQTYINRKNKKIELYKKYNLPLIEIEKDEPLYDSQNFKSRLKKQLRNLAKKYYKCEIPEWI